jgi:transcriptional regulator with XRE-family HTH domain
VSPRGQPQRALGTVLRDLRVDCGLTQAELGRATELDATWISHLESGRKNPSWATVKGLAEALGVSVGDIAELETNAGHSTRPEPPRRSES